MIKSRAIPTRIAELRKQKGLTQLDLANRVGVTEATIANWEKGRSGSDWIRRVVLLCAALECSIIDLLTQDIGDLRKKAEITQFALAQTVGVRENTVAAWEKKGTADERILQIARLCEALECSSPDELLPEASKKILEPSTPVPLTRSDLIRKLQDARIQHQTQ